MFMKDDFKSMKRLVERSMREAVKRNPLVAMLLTLEQAKWKDDDRKFFQENNFRSFRLRPAFPGEFAPVRDPGPGEKVLVRQLQPGTREKMTLAFLTAPAVIERLAADDNALLVLWSANENGEVVKLADVFEKARAMASAATANGGTDEPLQH
jgi:hypothetical protein